MFLVLLPRTLTENRGEEFYPVFIAEIDSLLPAIKASAFNLQDGINFGSTVSVKRSFSKDKKDVIKDKWFDLPKTDSIPDGEIRERLFIERFSKREFNRLSTLSKNEEPDNKKPSQSKNQQEGSNKELKTGIGNLNLEDNDCDDWEDAVTIPFSRAACRFIFILWSLTSRLSWVAASPAILAALLIFISLWTSGTS
jgi:hypothetical protein